jgi:hypothetical protein
MWYLVFEDLRTGEEQFVMHYDEFSNQLELTDDVEFRQEYLSVESLLEDINNILTHEPEQCESNEYKLTICRAEY